MKAQTTIYIVRHGEAVLPRGATIEIDKLRELTENGKAQATRDGDYLSNFPISNVYCSDVLRVRQTAEIIAESLDTKLSVQEHSGLSEIYTNWDFQESRKNIAETIKDIVRHNLGKQVIVVTHQLVIAEALKQLDANTDSVGGPISQGEFYRLVFAGEILVETQKISL